MKRLLKIVLSVLFIAQSLTLVAQENEAKEIERRSVTLSYPDSVVKFEVMVAPKELNAGDLLQYFWYDTDKLKTKKGSYSGKLLHGDFNVFGLENNMLVDGSFNEGLQHGLWKRWTPSGDLVRQAEWKNGIRDGVLIIFNSEGVEVLNEEYVEGLRHGRQVSNMDGEERIFYYLKGEKTDKETFEKQQE